ncbi:MAG TPA: hypothetical protein VFU37_03790 [Pyrinomonadaceae bacterium]|nr:hypothetical protein [Pyrinomonadaceae bacterium]
MRPRYSDVKPWFLLPPPDPTDSAELRFYNLIIIAILAFITLGMLTVGFVPDRVQSGVSAATQHASSPDQP